MSISRNDGPPAPAAVERAMAELKGKDDPFESLARPQRAGDDFADLHVPALQRAEREQLLAVIDSYRLAKYQDGGNLRPSRVVTVRGDRGSGKTHLLQSLVARPDRKAQLVVRPLFFEEKLEFEEYLLGRMKTALGEEDEFFEGRPLDLLARSLTRRLLRQAVLAAGPTDRLFALRPRGFSRFRLLWGGGEGLVARFERLVGKLEAGGGTLDVHPLLVELKIPPETALRMIESHLRTYEAGGDHLKVVRRSLYGAMARSVLLRDGDALPRFLAGEYQQTDPSGSDLRSELVAWLFHALVEACALVQMPVVFAFDNLERLFSPQNRFDGDLTRAFLSGLAQAVDNTRGVLFLLFAESTLFAQQVVPHMDEFARDRLNQGVPLSGSGPVHLIDLKPPDADDVRLVVRYRVKPLLAGLSDQTGLPDGFPFSPDFIAGLTGTGSVSLRNTLLQLRDEYSRVVYSRAGAPDVVLPNGGGGEITLPPPPTDWTSLLESAWNRGLSAARRKYQQETPDHHELHACLGGLLQASLPLALDGWQLTKVEPTLPAGENPDYGVVTLLDWKVQEGNPLKGPQSLRVGVGFLLAGGPGLAHDLRAKFDFLRDRKKGVRLLILWLTQHEAEDLTALLPAGTRKAWDEQGPDHWRTCLRRIDELAVRRVLAFANVLNDVQENAQGPPPPDAVRAFLHQRQAQLFPLLLPPVEKGVGKDGDQ